MSGLTRGVMTVGIFAAFLTRLRWLGQRQPGRRPKQMPARRMARSPS